MLAKLYAVSTIPKLFISEISYPRIKSAPRLRSCMRFYRVLTLFTYGWFQTAWTFIRVSIRIQVRQDTFPHMIWVQTVCYGTCNLCYALHRYRTSLCTRSSQLPLGQNVTCTWASKSSAHGSQMKFKVMCTPLSGVVYTG